VLQSVLVRREAHTGRGDEYVSSHWPCLISISCDVQLFPCEKLREEILSKNKTLNSRAATEQMNVRDTPYTLRTSVAKLTCVCHCDVDQAFR
jgi:hypothetical protein